MECCRLRPQPRARVNHTATLLPDGKVLLAGGYNGTPLVSAALYDSVSGTWFGADNLNIARGVHTATLLPNGSVLVAGGLGTSGPLASSELYTPGVDTWTVTAASTSHAMVTRRPCCPTAACSWQAD